MKKTLVAALVAAVIGSASVYGLTVYIPSTTAYTSNCRLTWTRSYGASKYYIYRATTPSWSRRQKIGTAYSNSFNDTSAVPGVNYYYWVCPVKGSCYWYNTGKYRLGYRQVTAPKVSASWKTYNSCIRLSWSAAYGAVRYNVRRSTSSSFSRSTMIGSTTSRVFNDTSAVPGTKYYYWVCPVGRNGRSWYGDSKRDYGMRALIVPQPSIYRYSSYVYVYWPAVRGAVKYRVAYASSYANFSTSRYLTKTTTYLYDYQYGGSYANQYYYWVMPVCSDGTYWYNKSKYVVGWLSY